MCLQVISLSTRSYSSFLFSAILFGYAALPIFSDSLFDFAVCSAGSEGVTSVVHVLLGVWFAEKELATAVGLTTAMSRAGLLAAYLSAPPVAVQNGVVFSFSVGTVSLLLFTIADDAESCVG